MTILRLFLVPSLILLHSSSVTDGVPFDLQLRGRPGVSSRLEDLQARLQAVRSVVLTSGSLWTWRQRAQDPRFGALLALGLAGGLLGAAIFGGAGWGLVAGLVLVLIVVGALALLLLPPWRDSSYGPWAGALVLAVGAVVVAAVALSVK